MKRTSIMADESTLERLRAQARDRRVSLAVIVREALEEKAGRQRPKPRLGIFASKGKGVSAADMNGRVPPRDDPGR